MAACSTRRGTAAAGRSTAESEAVIDRLRALIGFAPVGLDRWVRAAVGSLPLDVAPWVALGALALAMVPLVSAGAAKEIVPVTSVGMVDRMVSTTVTYVSLPGLATAATLTAPGATTAPPYGLLVRDAPAGDDFTIVTSDTPPSALGSRYVIGRLVDRASGPAASALRARGEDPTGLLADRWVVEVSIPEDEPVHGVQSVSELAGLADGVAVRIPLAFQGEAVPTCRLSQSGCSPRVLAAGEGNFVHLARGIPTPDPVLVQTAYPTSVVRGQWTGTQVRNGTELEAFASSLPVQALAGWGRILVLTSIADDPTVPRDTLWLGPALLAATAVVLWLGLRIGYPVFRPLAEGSRRWAGTASPAAPPRLPARPMDVRVSGHAVTVAGRWRHLDEERAVLHPAAGSGLAADRATASIRLADGAEIALAAHDVGSLGSIERGEVVYLHGVRPALWAHWFGTDLRITFDSTADRDAARELVGDDSAP